MSIETAVAMATSGDQKYSSLADQMEAKLQALLKMPPVTDGQLPSGMPNSGVYLFSEFGKHLYVGRSAELRSRYGQHCLPGVWHNRASFAVRLARTQLGIEQLGYRPVSDRHKGPVLDSQSAKAFTAAKARIRAMDFRFIEEADPKRRALLQIYCAVALQTPYNDFDDISRAEIQIDPSVHGSLILANPIHDLSGPSAIRP